MICFVCEKEVSSFDDKVLFGVDGDCIHKKCEPYVTRKMDMINNMNDNEFSEYLRGIRECDASV